MSAPSSTIVYSLAPFALLVGGAFAGGCASGGGDQVASSDQHIEEGGGSGASKPPASPAVGATPPAATAPSTSGAPPVACTYAPVNVQNGTFTVGDLSVDFGDGDGDALGKPSTVWQGPIVITSADTPCTVDEMVSVIAGPTFFDGSRLLVSTASGSSNVLYALDGTCRVLWSSESYEGTASVDATGINLEHLDESGHTIGTTRVPFKPNCLP